MNKNAKAWVDALRSGAYKQGKGRLRTIEDRFCCLGVASDLYIETHPECKWDKSADEYNGYIIEGAGGVLTDDIRDWLGLTTRSGSYNKHNDNLVHDNDSGNKFKKIADIIESEPEGLFVQ